MQALAVVEMRSTSQLELEVLKLAGPVHGVARGVDLPPKLIDRHFAHDYPGLATSARDSGWWYRDKLTIGKKSKLLHEAMA
jgi:hypothetical protein